MRSSRLLLLVLVPSLAVAACAQEAGEGTAEVQMEMASGAEKEAIEAAIAEVRDEFSALYRAGDAAGLAALFTQDGFRMEPNETMQKGRQAVQAALAEEIAEIEDRGLTIVSVESGASGALAYDIGTYTVTGEAGGEPLRDEGKYAVILKRTADGAWKIHANIFNSNLPLEEPMARE